DQVEELGKAEAVDDGREASIEVRYDGRSNARGADRDEGGPHVGIYTPGSRLGEIGEQLGETRVEARCVASVQRPAHDAAPPGALIGVELGTISGGAGEGRRR